MTYQWKKLYNQCGSVLCNPSTWEEEVGVEVTLYYIASLRSGWASTRPSQK